MNNNLHKSLHCCNKIQPHFRKWVSIHILFFLKYQNHFDMKKSPFKNSGNSWGEGGHLRPLWNGKSWGVGGVQIKESSVGGVWIFSGTTHLFPKLEMPLCTIWLCRPLCCVANKTWWGSLAVHVICSFINHKWDLVCYSFSKLIVSNITGVSLENLFRIYIIKLMHQNTRS